MGTPFISRDDLTDKTGRDVTGDDGGLIAVDFACDVVRNYAEQNFTRGTTTGTFDGTGTDAIMLSELPVNGISAVSLRSSSGSWTAAGTADFSAAGGQLVATNTAGTATFTVWPAGRQNVRVTYDHGYDEVPEAVRGVALALAERFLIQGVAASETVGDVSTTYAGAETELLATERGILRRYRRQ